MLICNANALKDWRDVSLDMFEEFPELKQGLNDDTCDSCMDTVAYYADIARNQTALDDMTQTLQSLCKMIKKLTDKQEKYESVAAGLVKLLPFIEKQAEYLAWDSPEAICALVGKCSVNCCS